MNISRNQIATSAACLLLAVVPSLARAQGDAASRPSSATESSGAVPVSKLPPATGDAALPPKDVSRLRRLVRDVQTNTDNIKSRGDFGAQLWLVQGQQFFQDWRKPATPTIDPVTIVPRGQDMYTAIIFYGAARNDMGLSNVGYDITVKKPDGSIYSQAKGKIGFQDLAADPKALQLGHDYLGINIGIDDPAGAYTVEVLLRDNVSRMELPLKQTFLVQ